MEYEIFIYNESLWWFCGFKELYSLSFLPFTRKWIWERKILLSYSWILPLQFPNDIYYYQSSRWLRDKMQGHKWSSTDQGILEEMWAYIYIYIYFTFSYSHANEYENVKFFFLIVGYFLSNFPMIFLLFFHLPIFPLTKR